MIPGHPPGVEHVITVQYVPNEGPHQFIVECSCQGLLVALAEHRVGPEVVTHLYQSDERATPS